MLIMRNPPERGVFLAIWPRRTPDGWAVGWLCYRWNEPWGWGSGGHYDYTVYRPDVEENKTERAEIVREEAWTPPCRDQPASDALQRRIDSTNPAHSAEQVAWAEEQAALFRATPPTFYTTPPNTALCRNLRFDGPTACWHPHCTCMHAEPPKRNGTMCR